MLVKAVLKNDKMGSSTVCMAKLVDKDGKGMMQTTNLGDSGYLIYRTYYE